MKTIIYCDCGRYRAEIEEANTRVLELVLGLPVRAEWPDPLPHNCLTRWIREHHPGCSWRVTETTQVTEQARLP
jgi:hypothetical protein